MMTVSLRLRLLCLVFYLFLSGVLSSNCTDRTPTFVRRLSSRLRPGSLPASNTLQVPGSPPTACFVLCSRDARCSAYFVDYRNGSCTLVLGIGRDLTEDEMTRDEETSYHRKVCLRNPHCTHEWVFDEVRGVQLFHYHDKTVPGVDNSTLCMDICLAEDTFVCRSARFDSSESECVLSRHDRRSAAEVFRQSPKHDEVVYLERQCVEEPGGCHFRSRQSRSAVSRHVHVVPDVPDRAACEEACLQSAPFPCRSYEYGPAATCLLSPEDSASLPLGGEESAGELDGRRTTYFERESCVDVSVECGASSMRAVVRVSTPFRGRVYAAGHPYDCYSVSVSDSGHVTLEMPLHSPRKCGTRNMGNGTFVNSVVVQHHAFVLRTSDRRIDVACDYEEMKLKIRGSKGIKQGEMRPLAHTVTAVAPTPPVRLRVVNASDQDVTGVELGDPLFLKVELADESVYGIFGSDLVARGSSGSETVLLIDEKGCPVEPSVFQALDRLPGGSKSLVAPFQAFKFASDSAVQFQMTVSYCLDTCPPADCDVPRSVHSQSYGKRRRKRSFLDLQSGDVISDVTMESPTFLVTNLKPTLDMEHPKQLLAEDFGEGDTRVKVQQQGLCVNEMTLYIAGGVVGGIQVIIVCSFLLIFCCRTREDELRTKSSGSSSKSWPSVSSRRKLVCSHS